MKRSISIFSAVLALVLASLACGSSSDNTGQKVGEVEAAAPVTAESSMASPSLYTIGDIIQLKDHTIVLNSVEFTGGILTANFTVENNSNTEMTVSSLLSFSARDDDGTKLEQEWMCSPGLDGSVLAGDKLRGNLCFKTTGIEPYKLYYEASLFGSGAVVWQVEP
jgi:hypothetical protein